MAIKYLDPKIDIVFKKIFGTRKHITIDFLNAMLPLPSEIIDLEFVTGQLTPEKPFDKFSIVDVRCRDANGRQFLVEMQNRWERWFIERIMFSSSLAYVTQLQQGQFYDQLRPVYMLALLDAVFLPAEPEWHHHFMMARNGKLQYELNFIQAVVAELPKHPDDTLNSARDLWARFLSDTDEGLRFPPPELEAHSPIREALQMSEEAAFDEPERDRYLAEREARRLELSFEKSRLERELKIREQEKEIAEQKRKAQEQERSLQEKDRALEAFEMARQRTARNLLDQNLSPEAIAEALDAELDEVKKWLGLAD